MNWPTSFLSILYVHLVWVVVALGGITSYAEAKEAGALVTLAEGEVTRATTAGVQLVTGFTRLKEGEVLALSKGARLRLIYFPGGRQETWAGTGQLEIGRGAGLPRGLQEPRVDQLSSLVVQQIERTPSPDDIYQGKTQRSRSIPAPDAVAKVEILYRDLRTRAPGDDLNPEMYRLSALFELRALDQVEQALRELRSARPDDFQAKVLVALYQRAIKNTKAIESH